MMPPVKVPFLHIYASDGKIFAYYRREGRRVRIRAEPGTEAFPAAYDLARRQWEQLRDRAPQSPKAPPGTLSALILAYRAAPEFREKAPKTQADYGRVLKALDKRYGDLAVASLPRAWVLKLRDEAQGTPRMANYRTAIIRALFAFGRDRDPALTNPAAEIKPLKTGEGHRIWTDTEIAAMTSPAAGDVALPCLIALHTAQRQADVLRLPRSAYNGQAITLRQGKTGAALTIPVRQPLKAALDAISRDQFMMCLTASGKPWGGDYFRHRFAEVRDALKLPPDLHFHGLRHTAATRLAEAGASDAEIMAMTGHKTRSMVTRYTAGAQQHTLAKAAVLRLGKQKRNAKSG